MVPAPGDPALPPLSSGARRDLAWAVAAGTFGGALVVAQAWWLAAVIDRVFLGGAGLDGIGRAVLVLLLLAAARAACAWTGDALGQRAAARAKLEWRRAAMAALVASGPIGLARERTGEIAHALGAGADALDGYVAQYLPQVRLAAIVPVIVLAAVAWADLLSAAVLVVTLPLIPLFMYLVGASARERSREQWALLSRLSARLLDALQGLPTLKAFGRVADETATIADRAERFRVVTMEVLKLAFVSSLVLELLATLGTAIVAVEVGLRLMYARMAFHEALFVLILAPEAYRPLRALGAAYHAGMAGREALARLAALSDRAQAAPPTPGAAVVAARVPADREPLTVDFDDVAVVYARDRGPALRGVSFTLSPGVTVALAGPSGSGKSSCANVLLGFVAPAAGEVRVNGMPLSSWPRDDWHRRVAWVPQRPHLFQGTVADNLRLARPRATDDELWAALDGAAARRFVEALPRGLATPVGERAARLSGGQAQRLAIARALLADAPVVVLDEPTSQLDPWTEPEIAAAIDRLRVGRAVLLIAHRQSMLRRADLVVRLDGGRVVAQGAFHEVFAAAGTGRPPTGQPPGRPS